MNVSDVVKYLNIVLIVLFVVVLVALALFFLRGLARGWRYGTYRVIAFTVLFIICFTTLGVIADAIGNWDMTSFGIPVISIPLSNGNQSGSATLQFGTPYTAISTVISDTLKFYNVSMAPEALEAYANALAKSIVMLLLMSMEGSLLATLGNLIVLLLWHIAFKHIIPPDRRKESYKKGKLISAFEELVIGIVIGSMFLFPLTSMVNSFAYSWNSVDEDKKTSLKADNQLYNTIQTVVDTYDNSLFSKAFFSWTKGSGDSSFDMTLTSFLTKGTYDQKEVSVINEFSSMAKLSSLAIEGGLLSDKGFDQSKIALFAVSEYAPGVLRALGQSSLVTGIIPYALSIIQDLDAVKPYIKTQTGIDFNDSKYNYKLTLNKLADIYQGLINDKVLSSALVTSDGKLGATSDIVTAAFSKDSQTPMEDLMKALDSEDLAIVDTLIESAVYVMCCQDAVNAKANPSAAENTIGISDFFPEIASSYDVTVGGTPKAVPESFSSIKWGQQLAIVYDSLCQIAQTDTALIPALTKNLGSEDYKFDINAIMPGMIDHLDTYGSALFGSSSNVQSAESTSSTETSTNSTCLLDCTFLENAMPKVLTILQNNLNTSFGFSGTDALSLADVQSKLFVSDPTERATKVKTEFKHLFTVLSDIAGTTEGKNLLKDLNGLPGIYFDPNGNYLGINKNLLTGFTEGVKNLDSSLLASAILPKVFEGFLKGDASPLKSLGFDTNKSTVTTDDDIVLDFSKDVGKNLADLIKVYSDNQAVVSYLMSNSTGVTAGNADTLLRNILSFKDSDNNTQIGNLLKSLITNPLINPADSKNQNISVLLNVLLGQTMSSSSTTFVSDLNGAIKDLDSEGLKTEINSFVAALQGISDQGVLSAISSFSTSSNPNLSVLKDIDFETLFNTFNSSVILKSVLGDLLDSAVLTNVALLSDASAAGVSFKNVSDWAKEGKALNALIKAAVEIGDLSNIDYFHSDPTAINSILKALAGSGIFNKKNTDGTTSYVFPKYIADKMVSYFKTSSEFGVYFTDAGTDGTSEHPYTYNRFSDDLTALKLASDWTADGGEADKISAILTYVMHLNGFTSISTNTDWRTINPNELSGLLYAVTSSNSFGPILTYHLYEKIASTLGSSEAAFKDSNLDYLLSSSCTSSDRTKEAGYLSTILKTAIDPVYGLLDNDGHLKQTTLQLNDVSADFFVSPLLTSMASSNVFNTTKTGKTMTAFEEEYSAILVRASLYDAAGADAAVMLLRGNDQTATVNNWETEIGNLCTLLNDVQDLDLDIDKFDFASLFAKTNTSEQNETNRVKVENTLNAFNSCKTLFAALPAKLEEVVKDISGASDYGLDKANFSYSVDSEGKIAPYDVDEIKVLSHVVEDAYLCDFTSISVSAISSNDYLSNLLENLAASKIFNTTKDTTVGAMTSFETTMKKVLLDSGYYGDKTDSGVQSEVASLVLSIKSGKGWTGLAGEVKALENVANNLPKAIDGSDLDLANFSLTSYFGNDPTTQENQRSSLENFLEAIESSSLLYPGLPNKLKTSVSGISGATSYGLDKANFTYKKDLAGNVLPYDVSEVTSLTYIVEDANLVDFSSISVSAINSNAHLKDLLERLAASQIFNTTSSTASDAMTSFETTMNKVLLDSGYYGDATDSTVQANVKTVVLEVKHAAGWSGDTGEVKKLETIASSIPTDTANNEIDLGTFNLSTYFGTDATTKESQRDKLETFLKNINASGLLYPGFAAKVASSVATISTGSISLSGANSYYNGYFVYHDLDNLPTTLTHVSLGNRYDNVEINTLSKIFMNASGLDAINLNDLSTINAAQTSNLLVNLTESQVFNTLADKTDTTSLTVAQNVISQALLAGGSLNDAYYYASNPKDIASKTASNYTDSTTKAKYLSKSYFAKANAETNAPLLNGDTGSLKALLTTLQNDSAITTALTNGTTSGLSADKIQTLLGALNACKLYQDVVPNTLAKFITNLTGTISDVDLSLANPYYAYYRPSSFTYGTTKTYTYTTDASGNKIQIFTVTSFDNAYDEDEIATLSQIIASLNDSNVTGLFSSTKIANLDITTSDVQTINSLMNLLAKSYVFNLGGAYGGDNTKTSALKVPNDLSVFEQTLFNFYDQSGLADRAYDSAYDYQILGTYASKIKLYRAMKTFESYEDGVSPKTTLHPGDWAGEVDELTVKKTTDSQGNVVMSGLLYSALSDSEISTKLKTGSGSTNFSSNGNLSSFTSISPHAIKLILTGMNQLDLVHDAVPYSIASLVEDSLSFRNYSTVSFLVNSINAATYNSESLGTRGHYNGLSVTLSSELASGVYPIVKAYDVIGGSANGYDVSILKDTNGNVTGHTAGTTTYSFDIGAVYPLYFAVDVSATSGASISSLAYTFNTSNYLLNQSQFLATDSEGKTALDVIYNFSDCIYLDATEDPVTHNKTGGHYVNFSQEDDVTKLFTTGTQFAKVLDYIADPNGFYTRNFYYNDATYSSATLSQYDFASRDIVFRKMLSFARTYSGNKYTVDLGKYFAENGADPLTFMGAKTIFTDSGYSSAIEGAWLNENLDDLLTTELLYETTPTTVGTPVHAWAEAFTKTASGVVAFTSLENVMNHSIAQTTVTTTNSSGQSVVVNGTALLGQYLAAGQANRFINAELTYIKGGTYFTTMNTTFASMSSHSVNRGTLLTSEPSFYNSNFALLKDASSASILKSFNDIATILNLSKAIQAGAMTITTAEKDTIVSIYTTLDADLASTTLPDASKGLIQTMYLGTLYDYYLNRNYYHAGNTPLGIPEVDYLYAPDTSHTLTTTADDILTA